MSYIDNFINRLNSIPPPADHLLRLIRQHDRDVEVLNLKLSNARHLLLESLERSPLHPISRHQLQRQYRSVSTMEAEVQEKTNLKIALAQQLYTIIHEPTEVLDREISQRGLDKVMDQQMDRKKNKKVSKRGFEVMDESNEPCYCYCGRPSFGKMVFCENRGCQKQWFHLECIDSRDRKLPEKWYCRNCRVENSPNKSRKK